MFHGFLGVDLKTSPKESVRAGTSILNTFAGMVSPVMSLEIDHYINVLRCDAMCRLLVPFATTYSPKRVLNVVFLDADSRGKTGPHSPKSRNWTHPKPSTYRQVMKYTMVYSCVFSTLLILHHSPNETKRAVVLREFKWP